MRIRSTSSLAAFFKVFVCGLFAAITAGIGLTAARTEINEQRAAEATPAPDRLTRFLWIALAAVGSAPSRPAWSWRRSAAP